MAKERAGERGAGYTLNYGVCAATARVRSKPQNWTIALRENPLLLCRVKHVLHSHQ